jgi:vancomycin resistance protein YoaR
LRNKLVVASLVALLVLLAGSSTAGAVFWNQTGRAKILPGVYVDQVPVGGLTVKAAAGKISLLQEQVLSTPVKLTLGDRHWQVSRHDLGFALNAEDTAQRAFAVGHNAPLWKGWRTIWRAYRGKIVLPIGLTVDRNKAQVALNKLAGDVVTAPQDARLVVNNADQVLIIPAVTGRVLDIGATLAELSNSKRSDEAQVVLFVREQEPKVSTADVQAMKITGLLSAYTTNFAVSNINRTYNINVAADVLDNALIKPGEVFSFNRVVGPRSKEAGYKNALVIEQDQFVPGLGGGVCQVSSTLYNTALLAGLDIVERYNHSLPVTYVPLGRDATVAYGGADLKFRNNTSGYLYIRSRIGGGTLTFKFFGNTAEKPNVTLETMVDRTIDPTIVQKDDPNLYVGKSVVEQAGLRGYQVRAYRVFHKASGDVRKLLSNDSYKPLDTVVRIGKMPLPEPAPTLKLPAPAAPTVP